MTVDVWYEVNEYSGKVITIEGLFLTSLSMTFMLIPFSISLLPRVLVFLALFVVTIGVTIWVCVNRAKAFADPSLMSSIDDNL